MTDKGTKTETGKMPVHKDPKPRLSKLTAGNQEHVEKMRAGRKPGEPVGVTILQEKICQLTVVSYSTEEVCVLLSLPNLLWKRKNTTSIAI